jgi:predicted TIM-barrel fold metal-dependent hydrolase
LAGVLLPPDTVDSVQHLYYPKYDALWALCCDLNVPVGMHGIIGGRGVLEESGPAGLTMDLLESGLGPGRSITSLIMSGVFDRYPTLRWVQTERGVVFASEHARRLDAFVALAQAKGTMAYMISRDVVAKLKKKPSEYVATNCYFGSFLTDQDLRPDLLTRRDHIMWGADYPHHEGVVPWTIKALRRNFAGWPEHEVRQVLAGTAAECYGFDLAALQSIADRIGPTVEEVSQPLTPAEVPRFPDETICPTFVDVDPSMGFNRGRQENPETALAEGPRGT